MQILRSSIAAGIVSVLLILAMPIYDQGSFSWSWDFAFNMVWLAGIIFVVASVVALTCLVLLIFIYEYFSSGFSLTIFFIVGFTIPFCIMYQLVSIPAHGETPALYGTNSGQVIYDMFYYGIVGSLSSIASWFTLKKEVLDSSA